MQASLITISYKGDLDLARDLCASVDRYTDAQFEHILIVPENELELFQPMSGERRRILSKESVLPKGYTKLPLPYKIDLRPVFYKLLREMWWAPTGLVRGWIVQQILKLAAPSLTNREIIVFADSDNVLIRPLTINDLMIDEKLRLYHAPGATQDSVMHRKWHKVSARLLGLEPRDYFGADYIGHLVTWRREAILSLQSKLEKIGGRPWDQVIARELAFSEYILYGIYAEHLLGPASGQTPSSKEIMHASWHYPVHTEEGRAAFLNGLEDHHVGVAIQSTDDFSLEERRALVARMQA